MFKKLITLWLILTMLASTSIPTFAAVNQDQKVTYFNRDIYVNQEKILNFQSATPYFSNGNHTYIPLTAENAKIFGFSYKVNAQDKIIEISKADISQKNYTSKTVKHTASTFTVKETDFRLFYNPEPVGGADSDASLPESEEDEVSSDSGILADVDENESSIDANQDVDDDPEHVYLNGTPIYLYKGVYYVSLGVLISIEELGWSSYYASYSGIYISTVADKPAKSQVNQEAIKENKILVDYMLKVNGSGGLKESSALNLLFLVKTKAQINKVDELLIIAMIAKESSFNEKAVARGGALGLMQIMPATGAKAGLSRAQLLTAEHNLDFGVKYIANSIKNFDNSWVKGLSAYNQGSQAVSRGSYSRAYYTKIITAYNLLKEKVGK